jgi:hypothetical protein
VFAAIGIAYVFVTLSRYLRLALLPVVLFAGFSAAKLYEFSGDWRVAGTMTRNIAHSIAAEAAHETVYLVNRPDRYRGAYVFRTGLQAAVNIFAKSPAPRSIRSIFAQRVDVPGAQASLQRNSGTPDTYTLSLLDDGSQYFFADPTYVELLETLPRAATFRFREPPENADLFFYTAGNVEKFSETP